ncbi:hypothetical protein FL857_11950 [Criibacterium bergeronii]|uniref:Uncharacterized protein n=1 Tax=Criibacterium bergeronii TaxID=1871336 RepID=A0A552UUL9_9FIRM|nr:hypothetical protein FL857_11950 [Criibacterium bergeronii]
MREKYHLENDNILNIVNKMKGEGIPEEEIGRMAVDLRNQNRLNSYLNRGDITGYERVLKSNMDMYGNSLGITPEMALERYGTWETVIEKTTGANPGMDACCGLYDKYYDLYGN